jgi:hypothetical protein
MANSTTATVPARTAAAPTALHTNNYQYTSSARKQSERFLSILRGGAPSGYLEVRCMANGKVTGRYWFKDIGTALDRIEHHIVRGNAVYVGVAVRSTNQDGGKDSLQSLCWLFTDLDFKRLKGGEEEARQILTHYPRKPQMIVATGGGYHVYWAIRSVTLPDQQAPVESALKRLADDLNGDHAATDVARILRLPGSWNTKPEYSEPQPVRFALSDLCDPDACYDLADFPVTEPKPAPPRTPRPEPRTLPSRSGVEGDANDVLGRALNSRSGLKIRRLMTGSIDGFKSASEADYGLCWLLAFWAGENGKDTVDSIFRMSGLFRPEKWDAPHCSDGRTYGEMTLDRAFEGRTEFYQPNHAADLSRIRQQIALTDPPADEDGTDSADPTEETPPEATGADPEGEPTLTEPKMPEPAAPDAVAVEAVTASPCEALATNALRLEQALIRLGAVIDGTEIKIPADIDKENLYKIGSYLARFERRNANLIRWIWAAWYVALPHVGKGAHADIRHILQHTFGHEWVKWRTRLSEWARVYTRIPAQYRSLNRCWSYFEGVASLPEAQREEWLSRPDATLDSLNEYLHSRRNGRERTPVTSPVTPPSETLNGDETPATLNTHCVLREQMLNRHEIPADRHMFNTHEAFSGGTQAEPETETLHDRLTRALSAAQARGRHDLVQQLDQAAEAVLAALFADEPEPQPAEPEAGQADLEFEEPETPVSIEPDPLGDPFETWQAWMQHVVTAAPEEIATSTPPPYPYPSDAPVTVTLSDAQMQMALEAARERKRGHDHCRRADEDAGGADANLTNDLWGTRSEIGLVHFLRALGLCPEGWQLTSRKSVPGADFILNATRYEVKSVPPSKTFACINQAQHNAHRCDAYLICAFTDDRTFTVYGPVPHTKVSTWRRMNNGHSPYYSIDKNALPTYSVSMFNMLTE